MFETAFGKISIEEIHKGELNIVCESKSGVSLPVAFIKLSDDSSFVAAGPGRVYLEKFKTLDFLVSEFEKIEVSLLGENDLLGLKPENIWLDGEAYDKCLVPCVNEEGLCADSRPDVLRCFIPKITFRVKLDREKAISASFINVINGGDGNYYKIIDRVMEGNGIWRITTVSTKETEPLYYEEKDRFLKGYKALFK